MSVSLISLNIEGRQHLDRVASLVRARTPDIFCVQELCRADVPLFASALGAAGHFVPMCVSPRWDDEIGLGIFTHFPATYTATPYAGNTGPLRVADRTSMETRYETQTHLLLTASVSIDGEEWMIGTTHMPVTEGAAETAYQREALQGLLAATRMHDDIVFCGDFNAPRGRAIFSALAAAYRDNIPAQYETSIDGELHRAGPLPLMVDGLFSTSAYSVSDVELVSGVSDHCAIAATVARV